MKKQRNENSLNNFEKNKFKVITLSDFKTNCELYFELTEIKAVWYW